MADAKAVMLSDIRIKYQDAINADRINRADALDDLRFLRGRLEDQWDLITPEQRMDRVTLVVNRLPQFVKQVTGEMRQNKPEIRVLPKDDRASKETARVFGAIIRHIESVSGANRVYVNGGEQAVQCGVGHWRILTDYVDENSFDLDIIIKAIPNPLSVVWDPSAVDPLKRDAKYCFVTELVDRKLLQKQYPDLSLSDFDSSVAVTGLDAWRQADQVIIAEYWSKVRKGDKLIAYLSDGSTREVPEGSEEGGALQFDDGTVLGIQRIRKVPNYEIHQFRCTGTDILDKKPTIWPGQFIPIIRVPGEEFTVGGEMFRRGLIRGAKDSQRAYNYSRSAMVEHAASQPKAPYIGTAKMFQPFQAIWNKLNTSNVPYLPYEPDPQAPGQKPERSAPPTVPAAMYQEAQIADADMKATTGIYDASLGARSNETSGRAIRARQAEGDTSTFLFIDNQIQAIEWTATQLIDLIPKVFKSERVIRLIGEDDKVEGYAKVNAMVDGVVTNDLSVGCYDVAVSTGPSYATRRQEAAESILAFLTAFPNAGPLIGDLVPAMMDWPMADKVAERMKRALPAGVDPEFDAERQKSEPQQPSGPDPMQELQMRQVAASVAKAEAEADQAQSDAERAKSEATIKQVEAAQAVGEVGDLVEQLVQDRLGYIAARMDEDDNAVEMAAQGMPPVMAEQGIEPEPLPVEFSPG